VKAPSERTLKKVERVLRQLAPGTTRAVGGGVQLRLQGDGSRRFQIRPRSGGSQLGSTFRGL
jgi:hypothetical protein